MKPNTPKGTRDFTPEDMVKRNYIYDTIKQVFRIYGFSQIETPAMENLSSLMGKYGEEGDKLLFKILNSGDWASKMPEDLLAEKNSIKLTNKVSEKGLRYDLTVPFARYVVQHKDEIAFPFKRYQIQPVWRADRPQKGRYREFYQCDADIIGSDSLIYESECVEMIDMVFGKLDIDVVIKMNNRKILSGIAEILGAADKIVDITVAIDKLDKIGLVKVNDELRQKGLSEENIETLRPIIMLTGSNEEKLTTLKTILQDSEVGMTGIEELEQVLSYLKDTQLRNELEIDLTLARGLSYYTGAIFEVKASGVEMGSITGGGRYDNLTGIFGLPNVSGVGFSFGADRIYDVLTMLDKFPAKLTPSAQVLFTSFDDDGLEFGRKCVRQLRVVGISAVLYPEASKMKKQMSYANASKIPYVAIIGDEELRQEKVMLKNMTSGEQNLLSIEEVIAALK